MTEMTTAERAIALSRLSLYVFHWVLTPDGRKVPLTERGHLDATLDPEQIASWFSEHPQARIGVHVGASGLVVADLDRKNEKDGFRSSEGWLDFPATFSQETPSNGIHHIYAAPEGIKLAPAADFQGFVGLDVRGGSSWIGWYGDVPADRTVFAPAPDWLLEPAREAVGGAFEGGLDEWLSTLVDPSGEPTGRVLDAIERVPEGEFGHPELIERQFEFVRLAAEGHPGVLHGLELLRSAWLRPPWDSQDYAYEFDAGLSGAVSKFGALTESIANLPKYSDLLLAETHPEVTNLLAAVDGKGKGDKGHWTRTLNTLIRFDYDDDHAASALWSAPSTKDLSREWGIEFVYTRVTEARAKHEAHLAEAEREVNQADRVADTQNNPVALLNDDEREYLADHGNFIHRYVEYAAHRFPDLNVNYHKANAVTVLSLTLGPTGFLPLKGKNLGLNLYQMTLGESSTGKSDSILLRDDILRHYFSEDGNYDLGSEASGEVLHEELLLREGKPTFFNSDEAAAFFRELARPGSWQAKIQDRLTDWYGGWCGPVNKRAAKAALKDLNKGAACYLVTQFYGTPDRIFDTLSEEQFLSGFLARFLWAFGEGAREEDRSVHDMQADAPLVHLTERGVEEFSVELAALNAHLGRRRPYKAGKDELHRLLVNEREMKKLIQGNSDWKLTESAYRRLMDSIRKVTGLLAASRGSTTVAMVDVLGAIEMAEVWVEGLLEASSRVASSMFEREAMAIVAAVKTMGKPWVTEFQLMKRFGKYEPRDFDTRLQWAIRTGYVIVDQANREHTTRYGYRNRHEDEED